MAINVVHCKRDAQAQPARNGSAIAGIGLLFLGAAVTTHLISVVKTRFESIATDATPGSCIEVSGDYWR